MKKLVGLGVTTFLIASSFFPDSLIFLIGIAALSLTITFFCVKKRLSLMALEKETLGLIFEKIIFEFLSVTFLIITVFLFIPVDYRIAFILDGVILIVLQILKIMYVLYARVQTK